MNSYVVRQAIKDRDGNAIGNEVLFQHGGDTLYNSSRDAMAADTIANFFMQNNEKIYDGKQIFITFTPSLLFRNTPKIFESDKLIIQIEDNVLVHPLSQMIIQKYRKNGYRFAINDFQFAPRYFSMLEYVDYIKINVGGADSELEKSSLSNIVRMAQGFKKQCIAFGVDNERAYNLANELGVDFLEGTYISDKTMMKASKVEYLRGNFFQLVVAVTKDEPDMDEIESIVSRDAYLSYALLKLANSKFFASRKRISDIRQGLVILGLGQLKQWVYLLSFQDDQAAAESEEILKVSFLRATFCSRLCKYIRQFPVAPTEAYMMGMFSTLDYMVDAPLEEILREIPIRDEIKSALIKKEGKCGQLYQLVLYYEKADWQNISKMVNELGIPSNAIAQVYLDCVEEVNGIWKELTSTDLMDEGEEGSEAIKKLNKEMK